MLYVKDKIAEDVDKWEDKLQDVADYAEEQGFPEKLEVYHKVHDIQSDIQNLKINMNMVNKIPESGLIFSRDKILNKYNAIKEKMANDKLIQKITKEDSSEESSFAEDLSESIENTGLAIKAYSKNKKEQISEDVEDLLSDIQEQVLKLENWASEKYDSASEEVQNEYHKLLNKLQYHKDNTASWLAEYKNASKETVKDAKSGLSEAFSSLADSWKKAIKNFNS